MNYFKLSHHIYASHFENSIIILDSANDNYLSLINPSAHYLSQILQHQFQYDDQKKNYIGLTDDSGELNYWIQFFLEKKIIIKSDLPNQKQIAPSPCKSGGLSEYQWDTKTSWSPFKHAMRRDIFLALITLVKINWQMKFAGIKGILKTIQRASKNSKNHNPSDNEITSLSHAVDAASLIYPKKTFCLAWAATFVTMANKRGWSNCKLVIGVQATPFYAHAWADINGKVIHDDPIIADVLSIIMKSS